jgi:microcystin-dependent protein
MAGTIAGLGYSQRFGSNGRPLAACKLYIYAGGTSTPSSVYSDYALGQAHTHPIVADAAGIIPMFWMADGTYRVRLTDADGNEVFDDDGVVAIGPSSGTGGGGSSVEAAALLATGDFLWQPVTGTRTGFVRANARTIGSAASGATERANADAEDLFLYLWTNFSDTLCPVTGGRGANAAADWAANKVIATLDMRGRGAFGLDDMGNTAAAIIAAGTPTAAGSSGGAETVTVAQANLPSVNFTVTGTAAAQTITDTRTYTVRSAAANVEVSNTGANEFVANDVNATLSMASPGSGTITNASSAVTGNAASGGSGTAVNKMAPYRLGSWYIKL